MGDVLQTEGSRESLADFFVIFSVKISTSPSARN